MRMYMPGLGRFFSVDPIAGEYPWYTPFQFAGNKPIWAIDLDGLEEWYSTNGPWYQKSIISGPYDPNILNQFGLYMD